MKNTFIKLLNLDEDNNEQEVLLNVAHIVTILPYEEGGSLIVMTNDEEYLVTTEFAELAAQSLTW